MNILFISSTLMVLGEFPFIVISQQNTFIKSYYVLGLTTSLLNHGYKSRVLVLVDRTVMTAGFFISLYYMTNIYQLLSLILSALCYFASKLTGLSYFHVVSHFLKTVMVNTILMKF